MGAQAETEFAQLSRRFRPALMSFFLRRVRSYAEAEDLTQDVFVRLTALDPEQFRSADAYIFRIATNLVADHMRRRKVRRRYLEEQMTPEAGAIDPLDPDRVSNGRRSLAALAQRLRNLPERSRAIFVLYRIEGVNKRAIAEAFNCSVSTVEKQIAFALAQLMLPEDGEP